MIHDAALLNGAKVRVYWNVHRKCWSVVALEGARKGLVVGHIAEAALRGPLKLHVSEAGRQRVLRTKRKSVHAWIEGVVDACDECSAQLDMRVSYNPYKTATFCVGAGLTPVSELLATVHLQRDGHVYVAH